jgi:hypothetical protein
MALSQLQSQSSWESAGQGPIGSSALSPCVLADEISGVESVMAKPTVKAATILPVSGPDVFA